MKMELQVSWVVDNIDILRPPCSNRIHNIDYEADVDRQKSTFQGDNFPGKQKEVNHTVSHKWVRGVLRFFLHRSPKLPHFST